MTAGFLTVDESRGDAATRCSSAERRRARARRADVAGDVRCGSPPSACPSCWPCIPTRRSIRRSRRRRAARARAWTREEAIVELLRGRVVDRRARRRRRRSRRRCAISEADADAALLDARSARASSCAGVSPAGAELEWCDRRLLARIHRYTLNRLRAEIEPVSPADFMRFLFAWQHVDPVDTG